jgi:hypothetical protein
VGVKRRLALLLAGLALVVAAAAATLFVLRPDPAEKAEPAPRPEKPPPPLLPAGSIDYLAARILPGARVALREQPGGRVLRRLGDTTEFGSAQTVAVAGARRNRWLAVRHSALGNDEVAWIDARAPGLRLLRRPVQLEVDLSRRELTVRAPSGVERRITVAIGAPDTPTPPGRFFVTDKLPGADFGPDYGCCILALSGRQPNLPEGWSGGDRLAIHGSPTPTWGTNVSNGCLHAATGDLEYLMSAVPLGTQVSVRA